MSGCEQTTFSAMLAEDQGSLVCLVQSAGEWTYHMVGDDLHALNGAKLEGLQRAAISSDAADRAHTQNTRAFDEGRPYRFKAPGVLARSLHLWKERITVPVRPPKGADRAVMSHYVWHENFNHGPIEVVRKALLARYGPKIQETFETPGMMSAAAQIALVRALLQKVDGAELAEAERAYRLFHDLVFFEQALPRMAASDLNQQTESTTLPS